MILLQSAYWILTEALRRQEFPQERSGRGAFVALHASLELALAMRSVEAAPTLLAKDGWRLLRAPIPNKTFDIYKWAE